MTDKIVNVLIAGIVGAVSFIVVRAMVSGAIYGTNSNCPYNTSFCIDPWGETNVSNCTAFFSPTAGDRSYTDTGSITE